MYAQGRCAPPEIISYIVKLIPKPQLGALLECSLVCHQWHLLVLPHLFSNLRVRLNQDRKSLQLFAQFLVTHEEIGRCIRELVLFAHPPPGQGVMGLPPVSSGSLAQVLQYLPSLETLTLQNLKVCHDGIAFSYPCSFKSLFLNKLYGPSMPHSGDIIDILSLFHHLGTLHIRALDLSPFYPNDGLFPSEGDI